MKHPSVPPGALRGTRSRADRRRSLWSLRVLLPAMILLAALASLVQQYLVSLHVEARYARRSAEERVLVMGPRLARDARRLLRLGDRASLVRELGLAAMHHAADIVLVIDGADRVLAASDDRWHDRPFADTPVALARAEVRAARESGEPRSIGIAEPGAIVGIYPLSPSFDGPEEAVPPDPRLLVLGASTAPHVHDRRIVASALTSALTGGALVLAIAGLFWFATVRVLLGPLDRLLSLSGRGQSAREALRAYGGRPLAELASSAETIDSLATARREHERALVAGNRLARIVEHSINEIYVSDAVTFRLLDANIAARENLGYTEDEIRELMPWDFVEGLTRDNIEAMDRPLRDGLVPEHVFETEHRRKDGSTYPVRTQLQYMASPPSPVYVAIVQDITEQRRRDAHIRLRERAIEAVEAGIVISGASADGYPIVYVNRALCEMTGYTVHELLGRSPSLLQDQDPDQPGARRIREAQSLGASVQTRLDCVRKDGSRFVIRLTLSPVHAPDGTLTHYIGIHEDITHESETEARLLQAQRIDAVGQLAGGIAHDFNNLLDIVIGNLDILAGATSDRAQLERVEAAHGAASMGARLTRRLLAFARQGNLDPIDVDVNEQVIDTLQLLEPSVGESIELEVDLADALWTACVDPSEIENTIVNLVINARDAIVGAGRIHISTANERLDGDGAHGVPAGDYVRLSVRDDGCGMSEEVSSRAFEPFYTTKGPDRGTGLGLASVHGFARQSGGAIEIETETGRGTTVSVYLPRSDGECGGASSGRREPTVAQACKGRVLIVEDNDKVREITRLRLRTLGFETLEASHGEAALRLLESDERIDLVLSDVVMPGGMSGYDLVRWLRGSDRGCPVLLVSGFAQPASITEALDDAAPPRVLAKPYTLDMLREAIEQVLS